MVLFDDDDDIDQCDNHDDDDDDSHDDYDNESDDDDYSVSDYDAWLFNIQKQFMC